MSDKDELTRLFTKFFKEANQAYSFESKVDEWIWQNHRQIAQNNTLTMLRQNTRLYCDRKERRNEPIVYEEVIQLAVNYVLRQKRLQKKIKEVERQQKLNARNDYKEFLSKRGNKP